MNTDNTSLEEIRRIVRDEIETALKMAKETPKRTIAHSETPWNRIRATLNARLEGVPGSDADHYSILTTTTTVIRWALDVRTVRLIPPEREAEALEIGHAVLDLMRVPRAGVAEGEEAEPKSGIGTGS